MIHVFMCNYNAGDRVTHSTESLKPFIDSNQMKLHFIDNNSKDGSELNVVCDCERFEVLPSNIGKAAAINALVEAAKLSDDDIMLLIDSDIKIENPNFAALLEDSWKTLSSMVSAIVCMQTGNSLHRREIDFISLQPRLNASAFFPAEGYGYGIAGGAMSVRYKDFKSVGGFNMRTGANQTPSIYGSNDGLLMLSLWNYSRKPICVIKELQVFHPPEPDKAYQQWKDSIHQEHARFGHAVTSKGFYS